MCIHNLTNWASILTFIVTLIAAIVGVGGYVRYRWEIRRKSKSLEEYLRAEKAKGEDRGQRSILRILSEVGLTEDEIIQASFRNAKISRCVTADEKGFANRLLLEYKNP